MRRRFLLLVWGVLSLTLLLPFRAAAAESAAIAAAASSNLEVTSVTGGSTHTLALERDGTVWAWGSNEYGSIDGSTTDHHYTPVRVRGLDSVSALAAGDTYSLALKRDGSVWMWGRNWIDGTNRVSPVQVANLSSVTAIAAGHSHNLAVKSDGTVWAWGWNVHGQLGDGSRTDRAAPVQVQGLDSVIAVAAGQLHSMALKSDGTVWAWGSNENGQNGVPGGSIIYDGPYQTPYRSVPVQIPGLDSVVAIAAGQLHNLALKSDGTVWAWGWNGSGQLGDGSTTTRPTPVQVNGLGSVSAIGAGSSHSLAVRSDGTVWAWGHNYSGALGDGSTNNHSSPAQVAGLDSAASVATDDGAHSVAVRSDGTVWAWGYNGSGQLGDGTTTTRNAPVQVADPEAPRWPEYDVLTATDVTANSVRLNWQPATDDSGVDQYLVYQDQTLLAAVSHDAIHYDVKGLSPATAYLFALVAVDGDGNESVKQLETVTTAADTPVSEAETLLYRMNGTLLDVDQGRILWKENGDKTLWLYDRTAKSQVKVYDADGSVRALRTANLSTDGVVFSLSDGTAMYWEGGSVRRSWQRATPYDVKGNFAVFGRNVVNVKTGASRDLPNANFNNRNAFDLSADGTVVYEYNYGIRRYLADGTVSTYYPAVPDYPNTFNGPLTDGNHLLYTAYTVVEGYPKWSLQVRGSDGEVTPIALNPILNEDYYTTDPRTSYQINNGWIAYKEYDKAAERWTLKVRSPEGQTKLAYTAPKWWQLTGVPLAIKQLGADGTLAFTFKDTTYLYSAQTGKLVYSFGGPGELRYREHIFAGPAGQQRYGAWYRVDGGALYAIRF
ncbi:fibronectin type III domain-containing protein [Paenibacillus sp. GCM10023250]|uniref:RCC1 domain-containing protein n=1 Tax=Paenibacillus sp. GCM10023250 TaxID=3252648 RepID=UPI00360FF431